ncbi:DUF4251 domain-containing protein [Mucilaginibacter sp. 14171R-50]|uniref:DUF4251 domain-containing protein n=1 Tax=Mucilaginibacter sp. 14171R-50 TaxID=2703789 RepID=UPI00138BE9D1|nr:DUF4251 domain-containing protein [Mucilaginibacter sp. 14171R-50]QHS57307.1 DUF4251 domain-containing protein [Mucilaginibacter sp. 14171R-50]
MKTLIKIIFALFITVTVLDPAAAQTKKSDKQAAKAAAIKQMVESKNFTFEANYAHPSYGNMRYLTPGYDVRVVKDTVVSYLPFFGVSYSGAGYSSGDEGIKFTSTDFTYSEELKKNGLYYVLIKPKDTKNANQLIFNISPSGTADLTVLSNNRERMRFSGNIIEKKK